MDSQNNSRKLISSKLYILHFYHRQEKEYWSKSPISHRGLIPKGIPSRYFQTWYLFPLCNTDVFVVDENLCTAALVVHISNIHVIGSFYSLLAKKPGGIHLGRRHVWGMNSVTLIYCCIYSFLYLRPGYHFSTLLRTFNRKIWAFNILMVLQIKKNEAQYMYLLQN